MPIQYITIEQAIAIHEKIVEKVEVVLSAILSLANLDEEMNSDALKLKLLRKVTTGNG